jgi:hypothetical protein
MKNAFLFKKSFQTKIFNVTGPQCENRHTFLLFAGAFWEKSNGIFTFFCEIYTIYSLLFVISNDKRT